MAARLRRLLAAVVAGWEPIAACVIKTPVLRNIRAPDGAREGWERA